MSNTINLNHCPKCGTPIPAGAPEGLCPRCVMLGAATGTESGVPATATSEIPSLERVAAAFPQLEILELIGRGGMGFVFKARQPHLDRLVALKLLPDKLARDPRFAERFNREGRVLARLNHPNIVSVYDFGMTEHFYFLLMEYVDGVNLRQAMRAGRFSPGEALGIVPKICEALQYAHGQGILHRDIKPENILLDALGNVKIADFGIAKLVGEDRPDVTLTATGAALGTPHYMAPEQLEKPAEVDHRADIYSLGVVFYEMLTGELPIGRFAAPSSKTPVSTGVDEVVFRTLEKDRERRYQSAGEVKSRVEHLTGSDAAFDTSPPGAAHFHAESGSGEFVVTRWSHKAVWGAAMTGLSLISPLLLLVLAFVNVVREQNWEEVVLVMSLDSLLALTGVILGWMALSDIRAHQGRLRGLPLAVFAALAWPLALLIGGVLVVPSLTLHEPSSTESSLTLARLLTLLIPAGVLTFAIWAVYAASRWGANQPASKQRGVLKWVFAGLLLAGLGVILAMLPNRDPVLQRPDPLNLGAPGQPESGPAPIIANFRLAKGQVATFELFRHDGDITTPIRFFSAYVVAPDEERGRFSLMLIPAKPDHTQTNDPAWRLSLRSEDGATVTGSPEDIGELIAHLPTNHLHAIEPDSSFGIMLTRSYPGAETNGLTPRPELWLQVVSQARGKIGGLRESTAVSVGTTNWMQALQQAQNAPSQPRPKPGEVLAYQWLKSPVGTNATNWIRFTFTNVELREEQGQQWLAMDYATDVRGDCEEVFRVDGNGFNAVTRRISLLVTPEDSPAVRRQRIEWLVPRGVNKQILSEFRDEVAKALIAKSFVIPEGEQRPLLRLPIGAVGDLSVGIGAKRTSPSP